MIKKFLFISLFLIATSSILKLPEKEAVERYGPEYDIVRDLYTGPAALSY